MAKHIRDALTLVRNSAAHRGDLLEEPAWQTEAGVFHMLQKQRMHICDETAPASRLHPHRRT